jgi:hypothetical protein
MRSASSGHCRETLSSQKDYLDQIDRHTIPGCRRFCHRRHVHAVRKCLNEIRTHHRSSDPPYAAHAVRLDQRLASTLGSASRRLWRVSVALLGGADREASDSRPDPRSFLRTRSDPARHDDPSPGLCEASLCAAHSRPATTALSLFWICTLLARAPQWQTALATEASRLDLSAEGAAANLPKLVLARAVVQETLRLYPPAFMTGRLAKQSHEICGTSVPKGSIIFFPFWLLHRSPRF